MPRDVPRARRSLSQNFLVDPNLQRKIVGELEAGPADLVVEIGPGHGELSQHLVGTVERLVLIEKDRDLAADLEGRWGARRDVEVLAADALEVDLEGVGQGGRTLRIVSNLPYNVTSPLLFRLLEVRPPPARIVVMVQKEVGERIVADPGSKTYGALSVGVQAVANAELRFVVRRAAFRPVPDVDSVVLRIDPDPERVAALDPAALRRVTRVVFSMRRKQLQKILRTAPELGFEGDPARLLGELGLEPAVRPERVSPAAFVRLARALGSGSGEGG